MHHLWRIDQLAERLESKSLDKETEVIMGTVRGRVIECSLSTVVRQFATLYTYIRRVPKTRFETVDCGFVSFVLLGVFHDYQRRGVTFLRFLFDKIRVTRGGEYTLHVFLCFLFGKPAVAV